VTPVPVLFVHHRPELGGAPTSLAYLIRELDRSQFEPHVYSPPGPVVRLFQDAGARVHTGQVAAFTHIWASTYSGRRWLLLGPELSRLPGHVSGFRRTLRQGQFGLVHLNDSPLIPAAWIAARNHTPVLWHLRSALPEFGGSRRSRLIRRAISSLGDASIAINDDVARSFDVGSDVIFNSVDLERFAPGDAEPAKRELDLPATKTTVTYFGFVYPSKGLTDFVEAAAALKRAGVEATYLIVGGGVRGAEFFASPLGKAAERAGLLRDHERNARELVRAHGLNEDVRFVPYTNNPAVLYRASDVVVAPSRGPELGRPLLEAAASGRPVVASGSVTGAGVVLPGATGELVPPASPTDLADALRRLIEDPARRHAFGTNARAHAEERFDPRANAQRVVDVYERLLRRPGSDS
jgi:glycosyltransferase involved in cell wall biosynthesis